MSWYAVDSVGDAVDAARRFLFPFDAGRWLRLAVIVFFLGGVGGFGNVGNVFNAVPSADGPAGPSDEFSGDIEAPPTTEAFPDVATVLAVLAVVALVVLAFVVISEVFRLVFYDALRTGEVRIREPFRRRFGQALRLLVFKLVVTAVVALPTIVAVVAVADPTFGPALGGLGPVAGVLLALVVFALVLVAWLVLRFTNEFVSPVMVLTDGAVLPSWGRFWPTLRGDPLQFLLYLFVHFFLTLVVAIGEGVVSVVLGGVVVGLGAGAALVVSLLLGGFGAAVGSTAGLVALAVVAVVTVLSLLVVLLPVRILVHTYVTAYEVLVLGAAEPAFALLPDDATGEPSPAVRGGDD